MADLPVPVTEAEDVRRIAESVLSRPEFAEARPAWWQQVLNAVADFVGRVMEGIAGAGGGSVVGTLIVAGAAVALLLVVLRFTRTLRADPRVGITVDELVGRSAAAWLAQAEEHEAAGEWREAVRCRYRGLLAALAAEGLLEEVPGRTTGEYLADVRQDIPRAAGVFASATRMFEAAWYGQVPVTGDDAELLARMSRDVLDAAGVRPVILAAP